MREPTACNRRESYKNPRITRQPRMPKSRTQATQSPGSSTVHASLNRDLSNQSLTKESGCPSRYSERIQITSTGWESISCEKTICSWKLMQGMKRMSTLGYRYERESAAPLPKKYSG